MLLGPEGGAPSGNTDPCSPVPVYGHGHDRPHPRTAACQDGELLSGHKKEIGRNSVFVLGATWLPFHPSSPSWKLREGTTQ